MEKRKISQILIILIISTLCSCSSKQYEIYISPNGNDNAKGILDDPIASPHRAAELAKEKAGEIPVTIYLSGGNYHLTKPLNLSIKDGGTAEAPVQWKAVPGEKPIISGGIPVSNWKKEDSGLWTAVFPSEYQGSFRSFYVNDRRAIRARFPENNYLRISKAGKDDKTNFFFRKNEIPKVKDANELELVFIHDWSITRIGVKSIDWKNNHLFTVDSIGASSPSFFTITNWEKHPRYYLENALEFCDTPGEWYCDFNERIIYYRPLPNEKINETVGVIPISQKLLTITGNKEKHVRFINFEGITFEHTEWQYPSRGYCGIQACMFDNRQGNNKGWDKVPAAIELDLAEKCGFYNCTIKHTGGSGVWIRENCLDCEISYSHIYDISGNGVNIGEGRDRLVNGIPWWQSNPEQVSKNNKVSNSLIEDCGKQFYGAVGIWGGLVANTVIDHNEIRNLPYTGISIGWMWNPSPTPCRENTINSNHIHHVMKQLSDGGGIYCLGLQPNSRITNNLIHDVSINAGRAESNGMFLDEGIKDLLVENNIIYNIARSPLRFHKAFQNVVRNNVFVCGDDIPPIRYNNTKEENIKKVDNTLLIQSSKIDMDKLKSIVEKRILDIGSDY
jgi:GH141 insertion domain/Right handed beta helix region